MSTDSTVMSRQTCRLLQLVLVLWVLDYTQARDLPSNSLYRRYINDLKRVHEFRGTGKDAKHAEESTREKPLGIYDVPTEPTIGECGGTYFDGFGEFYTPGWPNPYYTSSFCVYKIGVEGSSNRKVKLHFPTFNLYGNGCYNDYVDIYGGSDLTAPLIGRYCGNYFSSVDGNVTSAGSSLLLVFVSSSVNADGQYKGFHAQFWTVYDDALDAGTIAVIVVMCLLSLSVLLPLTYVLTTAYLLPCFKKTCGKEQANSAQSANTGETETADNESFDGFEAPDFPPPYYSISGEEHQTGTHVQIDGVGSDSASPMPNALSETATAGAGSGTVASSTFSNAGYEADAKDEQSAPSLPSYEEVLKLAKDEKNKEC